MGGVCSGTSCACVVSLCDISPLPTSAQFCAFPDNGVYSAVCGVWGVRKLGDSSVDEFVPVPVLKVAAASVVAADETVLRVLDVT